MRHTTENPHQPASPVATGSPRAFDIARQRPTVFRGFSGPVQPPRLGGAWRPVLGSAPPAGEPTLSGRRSIPQPFVSYLPGKVRASRGGDVFLPKVNERCGVHYSRLVVA